MTIRVDYIHEDMAASLGLAVLYRSPVAFITRSEREDDHPSLPEALSLAEVASIICK